MSNTPSTESLVADAIAAIWQDAARQGVQLPSEPDIASATGRSRPVVREALIRLEERGYIYRSQGTGTAVNQELLHVKARIDEQVDHSDVIARAGMTPAMRVVRQELSPVTAEESEQFRVAAGTPTLRTVKAWLADDVPVALASDSIPFRGSVEPSVSVDTAVPVFELAARIGTGKAVWETVWVKPVLLDATEQWMLGLNEVTPAVCLTLHGLDSRGATTYWARELQLDGPVDFAMVRPVRNTNR
ncbi:GntR family transcriptional regulator [Nocardia sp. NPDC024068]|uniref:GntR family transcriptional regulator n=1 Tax=Nocardia sp. NPDC024068 TaxID=3157197 RepID=UPI0033F4AD25